MFKTRLMGILLLAFVGIVINVQVGLTAETVPSAPPVTHPPVSQIIIQFHEEITGNKIATAARDGRIQQLSVETGVTLQYARPMSGNAHVLKLDTAVSVNEAEAIAAKIAQQDGVAFAEPDYIRQAIGNAPASIAAPLLVPDDPRYGDQWHYGYVANSSEGINLPAAWNITTGSSSVVVAVIDTGILNHSDLAGRTVPGYDFISDSFVGNDGNGRDDNPADPGDWIVANECDYSHSAQDSSWHGTHVAGTIGAASDNASGVAGVDWNAKILPVRVLGKCGGYTSDIVDGMRWAAGLPVTDVPANANPAKVLNMSLGGSGSCSVSEQNAINQIVAAGSTVVVAAGNSNDDASGYSPANCNNVITVASNNRQGNRAWYSNYGTTVEITAPGGDTSILANGVLSTLDSGATTPANDNSYAYFQGTSMAAPHVAGVVSLLIGQNPTLTPAEVAFHLQLTARPFPDGSSCNASSCGAGIVDAFSALNTDPPDFQNRIYLPLVLNTASSQTSSLLNPGFESGQTGWTEFSTHGWDIITEDFPTGLTPHGGSWAAWLGGDIDETSYVQQQVMVPSGTPYLAYWHWINSEDACGNDFGGVLVNGSVVDAYDLCTATNTGGWVKHTVNLGAYAGQTVTLQLRVETDESLNSNLFIDDVSFQASAGTILSPAAPNGPTPAAMSREAVVQNTP